MAALSNPKVMAAMQGMMSGGAPDMAKIQELMSDPEVGPAMQKVRRNCVKYDFFYEMRIEIVFILDVLPSLFSLA